MIHPRAWTSPLSPRGNLRLVPTAPLRSSNEPHSLFRGNEQTSWPQCEGQSCIRADLAASQATAQHRGRDSRESTGTSFHAPDYLSAHIPNTHEAGASVPRLSAKAGAASYTIMVPGCSGPLPSNLIKLVNPAHRISSFVSSVSHMETNRSGIDVSQKKIARHV